MCLLERNTFKRGHSAVPEIFLLTRACLDRRVLFVSGLLITIVTSLIRLVMLQKGITGYYLPVLPSLRRMISLEYLIPLPLYGSGGRTARTLAARAPTRSLL